MALAVYPGCMSSIASAATTTTKPTASAGRHRSPPRLLPALLPVALLPAALTLAPAWPTLAQAATPTPSADAAEPAPAALAPAVSASSDDGHDHDDHDDHDDTGEVDPAALADDPGERGPRVRSPGLDDGGRAQSIGAPDLGRLHHASRLRASRSIRLRFPEAVYGTRALVELITGCADEVARVHHGAHPLLVGDLSKPRGGWMPPHEGHQNGREADIGFYLRAGKPLPALWQVGPDQLDHGRQLTYLSCLIGSGRVLRVFLDRRLQAPLVAEARRRGWSEARITATFSYPRPAAARVGVVQHRRSHNNHLHLRLRCAPHEQDCIDKPHGKQKRLAILAARHAAGRAGVAARRATPSQRHAKVQRSGAGQRTGKNGARRQSNASASASAKRKGKASAKRKGKASAKRKGKPHGRVGRGSKRGAASKRAANRAGGKVTAKRKAPRGGGGARHD